MTITTTSIGRITGLYLDPGYPQWSGDTVALAGTIVGTADTVKGREMQFAGLVNNPDEPVIPVARVAGGVSVDPTLYGFYRVVSANVSPMGPSFNGHARWNATLQRMPGYATAAVEVSTIARQRHLTLTPSAAVVLVGAVGQHRTTPSATFNRTGEEGELDIVQVTTSLPWEYQAMALRNPDDFYLGSCRLEVELGSDWFPVVGRQVPAAAAGKWRLTNGLIRLTCDAGTVGDLDLEVWDEAASGGAGAWEGYTVRAVNYASASGAFTDELFAAHDIDGTDEWLPPTVIRNDPASITLMFDTVTSSVGNQAAQQSFTIRQGQHFVEYVNSRTNNTLSNAGARVVPTATGSTSGLTSAMQAASDDANGNRYVIATNSNNAGFLSTANARVLGAASTNSVLMLGIVKNAASPATDDTAAKVVDQWAPGVYQSSRVVRA